MQENYIHQIQVVSFLLQWIESMQGVSVAYFFKKKKKRRRRRGGGH
jgi:hypothetical protein